MDGVVATINVTTTGVHTLNVWMREDGFIFDKLVVSTNVSYIPTGTGPAETTSKPVINPNGVLFTSSITVTMTYQNTIADIRYTLDGSVPTISSTLYTGPINLIASAIVNAAAFDGSSVSGIATAYFNLVPVTYDFATGAALADWTIVDDSVSTSTSWAVTGGELVQSGERDAFGNPSLVQSYHQGTYAFLPVGLGLTDYRVSVDMVPKSGLIYNLRDDGHDIGLMFRYQDNDNYYRIALNTQYGYARMERKVGGVFSTLAVDARGYLAEGLPIQVAVEVIGDLIQVYIDGEARFAARDSSLSSGTVALYTQDGAAFDNVVIDVNNTMPAIVIAEPVAYTTKTGSTINVSAVATNIPPSGTVEFDVDGVTCDPATEVSPGYFTSNCSGLVQGEHAINAQLKDSGLTIATDNNVMVGSSGDVFITLGDSISNGVVDNYSLDNQSADGKIIAEQGYVAVLQDLLYVSSGKPHIVFNEAVPADRSSDLLNDRVISILERHLDVNKANILIGTNDAGGTLPLPSGLGCSGTACNGTYKENIQNLMTILNSAGIRPIIARVPPAYNAGVIDLARNVVVQEYNQVILTEFTDIDRQLGPDFYGYYLGAGENRVNLYQDSLHFNGLGYFTMAYLWDHYINGGTTLPSRAALPLILEGICIRISSSTCQDPLLAKQNLMQSGDRYYVDQDYVLNSIPIMLSGGLWINTADSDKGNTRTDYLTFTIDRDVDLYVAYDAAATTLPSWLSGFTDTGLTLAVSNPLAPTMKLYQKSYAVGVDTPPDGTIQLGGNLSGGTVGANANYIVIVKVP